MRLLVRRTGDSNNHRCRGVLFTGWRGGRPAWGALSAVGFALGLLAAVAFAGQEVVLEERIESTGTVIATSRGSVEMRDAQGQRVAYRIQPQDDPGISLSGTQAMIRFPAKVRITGQLGLAVLEPGMQVRFASQLNRLGRSEGLIHEILLLEDEADSLGLEIHQQAATATEFAEVTVAGRIHSFRNDRLVLTIPPSPYLRRDRLAFQVASDAIVRVVSEDHRRAGPGDRVVRLAAARFSTGDAIIQELEIELDTQERPRSEARDPLRARYGHLSDQPGDPREVSSPHFLLRTDVSDRQAQILLDRLETMLDLISRYYGHPLLGRIEGYVVRDVSRWPPDSLPPQAVAKIQEGAGVTLSRTVGGRTRSVFYSCEEPRVVQHEAVHAYCAQTFGSTGPTWYAEGMAELGAYWEADQRAVDVDARVIHYLQNSPPEKLLEIVAADQITGDSWQAYAWRWALCHLLANNPNYSGPFKALGIALMTGQPGASFERVYGPMAREVSFEYDFFVHTLDNGYRADLCAWQWDRPFHRLASARRMAVEVQARYGWQASGLRVERGQSYDYVAEGTWRLTEGDEPCGPDGQDGGRGRLVGVLKADFQLFDAFDLGERGSFVAPRDADLYLRCQNDWNRIAESSGSLTVHFRRTPEP